MFRRRHNDTLLNEDDTMKFLKYKPRSARLGNIRYRYSPIVFDIKEKNEDEVMKSLWSISEKGVSLNEPVFIKYEVEEGVDIEEEEELDEWYDGRVTEYERERESRSERQVFMSLTPLFIAAYYGKSKIVNMLINKVRVDMSIKDDEGRRASEYIFLEKPEIKLESKSLFGKKRITESYLDTFFIFMQGSEIDIDKIDDYLEMCPEKLKKIFRKRLRERSLVDSDSPKVNTRSHRVKRSSNNNRKDEDSWGGKASKKRGKRARRTMKRGRK
jgi:hypothetical protein